jgi:hypothetical protein
MFSFRSTLTFFVVGIFWVGIPSGAERLPVSGQPPTLPTGTHPLTQNSGYEFAGTVEAVEHVTAAGRGVSTTRITFHVDAAVRGVHTGQTVVITEWGGLWGSREQYSAGERVFLFLYPLSKLGLTSPVQGTGGRFRIAGNGRVVVRPEQKGVLPERVTRIMGEQRAIELSEFANALRMADKELP